MDFKAIKILLTMTLLSVPSSTAAQIIIPPEPCPPGYDHIPPNQCIKTSPSPTPSPSPKPVIIVPGMLASLNVQTTLLDQAGGTWDFIAPARDVYRGLIERLEQAGLDVTVAHYDWRHTAAETSLTYLKDTIDDVKNRTGTSKVDIVAHSMGGLVARDYIQGPQYEDDIDQLVTIGTPHKGAADGYVAREGGHIPNHWSAGSRLYLTLVERTLNAKALAAPIPRPESFRTFFPSLQDLLPTEPFITQDGTEIALDQMAARNLALEARNNTLEQDLSDLDVDLTTLAGTGLNTLATVSTTTTSLVDQLTNALFNRWRDGHPTPNPPSPNSTEGDQTVLLASAKLDDTTPLTNIEHDKLPEELQAEVLAALGVNPTGTHIAYDLPDSVLGTVVLSPITPAVTLPDDTTVTCDSTFEEGNVSCLVGNNHDDPKLLIISNPTPGNHTLTYSGTGEGDYTTITTYADPDETVSSTTSGTITSAEIITEEITIGTEDSSLIDDADYHALLQELSQKLRQARRDKTIPRRTLARATRQLAIARLNLRLYEHFLAGDQGKQISRRLTTYHRALDQLNQLELPDDCQQIITKIKTHSPTLAP